VRLEPIAAISTGELWTVWTTVDEFHIAVTGPWRYCRGAVMSLLWPTICEVVKAAHGFICSHCIASTLALPGPSRLGGVEAGEEVCARCRMRRRVIRSCEEPDHASGVIAATRETTTRSDTVRGSLSPLTVAASLASARNGRPADGRHRRITNGNVRCEADEREDTDPVCDHITKPTSLRI